VMIFTPLLARMNIPFCSLISSALFLRSGAFVPARRGAFLPDGRLLYLKILLAALVARGSSVFITCAAYGSIAWIQ